MALVTDDDDRSRRALLEGLAMALAVVAAVTLILYPISDIDPGVSSGVLYVLGVLLVATTRGLKLGLVTAPSAFALDYFHTDPTGQLVRGQERRRPGGDRQRPAHRGDRHADRRSRPPPGGRVRGAPRAAARGGRVAHPRARGRRPRAPAAWCATSTTARSSGSSTP